MNELKSPKLLNNLAHKKQPQQLEQCDTSTLLQLFQKIQPVEIIKMSVIINRVQGFEKEEPISAIYSRGRIRYEI